MDGNDHDDLIEHLKGQAAGAADGRVVVHESANLSSELREQFWRHVVEYAICQKVSAT